MADFIAGRPHGDAERGRRDERLADFAQHRYGDTARPNAWHVMILNDLTGPGDRCPDATDDEALGLLGRWKAAESWAAARKLGVAREMIRRRAVPEKGMATAGLPWEWEPDLQHEVAAQLRVSLVAAGKLLHLAWSLEARLPHVGDALADGRLDPGQAKMIVTETDALPDDKATAAEELILAGLDDCHTWADLLRLVQQTVVAVDPDGARRRREQAERETARVRRWRESSGASALAGHALPTDDWLRHVIQVRDGKCSFPACGRHARESDFEHATPHEDGGKTCACNCHACSRTCHQVKQRPGWSVTSPTPGWHQWTTPAGRTYTQGPWQYIALPGFLHVNFNWEICSILSECDVMTTIPA